MDDDDDKGFFILVLGVLAAILMVVIWAYISPNGDRRAERLASSAGVEVAESHEGDDAEIDDRSEDHGDDDDAEDEQAAAPEPTPEPEPEPEPEPTPVPAVLASTVYDAAGPREELGVITTLLSANGLDAALRADGPFTLFAPTDDAANRAGGDDITVNLLEGDPQGALTYHVVPGRYTREDLVQVAESPEPGLVTLQGESINLSMNGDDLIINGNAILGDTQEADNGFLHTIDNVLVPPVAALNSIVSLEPILFATGSAEIDPASFPTLDQMIEILSGNTINVAVEGHTDSQGDALLNQNLSLARARSVVNYLAVNGVEESRIEAQGFGPDRPVADNATEEGRALNRRIEFSVR